MLVHSRALPRYRPQYMMAIDQIAQFHELDAGQQFLFELEMSEQESDDLMTWTDTLFYMVCDSDHNPNKRIKLEVALVLLGQGLTFAELEGAIKPLRTAAAKAHNRHVKASLTPEELARWDEHDREMREIVGLGPDDDILDTPYGPVPSPYIDLDRLLGLGFNPDELGTEEDEDRPPWR